MVGWFWDHGRHIPLAHDSLGMIPDVAAAVNPGAMTLTIHQTRDTLDELGN